MSVVHTFILALDMLRCICDFLHVNSVNYLVEHIVAFDWRVHFVRSLPSSLVFMDFGH